MHKWLTYSALPRAILIKQMVNVGLSIPPYARQQGGSGRLHLFHRNYTAAVIRAGVYMYSLRRLIWLYLFSHLVEVWVLQYLYDDGDDDAAADEAYVNGSQRFTEQW